MRNGFRYTRGRPTNAAGSPTEWTGEVLACRPSLEDHPWLLWNAVESLDLPKEKADKIKGIIDEWKTKAKEAKGKESKPEDLKTIKAEAAEVYKKVMAELSPEEQAKVSEYRPGPTDWYEWGKGECGGKAEARGKGMGHKHCGAEGPDKPKPTE